MIDGSLVVRVGDPGARPVHLLLSKPTRPFGDDAPTLDFPVKTHGQWVNIETLVRTWDGDGLHALLSSLAEEFRGWDGARTWRSLERDLTFSAERRPGGYVHLTWDIHDRPPTEEWRFETTTVHAAGKDMRNLATEFHAFLTGTVE
ncbi:DUF6228 family protein [Streptomyces sp. NPDC049906]|uniref:DUF6228 family protein n=1 Tax=Streptomyces sp. NPDC049906 TaxID=3155656 RepID=UPI00343C01CF